MLRDSSFGKLTVLRLLLIAEYDLTNGTLHWRGVLTASARFDVYLRQLVKVAICRWPNPFRIFITVTNN